MAVHFVGQHVHGSVLGCVAAVTIAAALAGCSTGHRAGAPLTSIATGSGPASTPAASSPSAPSAGAPGAADPAASSRAGVQSSAPATPKPSLATPAPATPAPATPAPKPAVTQSSSPSARKSVPPPAPKPTAPPPLLVEQLASVGNAQQVVVVTSTNWTTSVATLQTFAKDAAGWHAASAAMPAFIGRAGFSADKHEGDLKTPAGKFGFGIMFGQRANPGVKFPYRVPDSQSVWVDDSSTPSYNTWQQNAALTGEHLASSGFSRPYAYAAVIAYNSNPVVPGKGSAIFLHVSTGGGTAGCVSLNQPQLLQVLRWLDPAKNPIIVMGPSSVIRQY